MITCTAGVLPPHDDLIPFPFGLEKNAARGLIASGELRARKIGRRWYCKRTDLLTLIDNAPHVPPAKASGASLRDDLAVIAARTRTRRSGTK